MDFAESEEMEDVLPAYDVQIEMHLRDYDNDSVTAVRESVTVADSDILDSRVMAIEKLGYSVAKVMARLLSDKDDLDLAAKAFMGYLMSEIDDDEDE
jgi:monomeric isocitrate dehydrogenase